MLVARNAVVDTDQPDDLHGLAENQMDDRQVLLKATSDDDPHSGNRKCFTYAALTDGQHPSWPVPIVQ